MMMDKIGSDYETVNGYFGLHDVWDLDGVPVEITSIEGSDVLLEHVDGGSGGHDWLPVWVTEGELVQDLYSCGEWTPEEWGLDSDYGMEYVSVRRNSNKRMAKAVFMSACSKRDFIAGYMAGTRKVSFDARLKDVYNEIRDDAVRELDAMARAFEREIGVLHSAYEDDKQALYKAYENNKRVLYSDYIERCSEFAQASIDDFERILKDDPELLLAFRNDREEIQQLLYDQFVDIVHFS